MPDQSTKTPGQIAYEADLLRTPLYPDGGKRRLWEDLIDMARQSWERNPTTK